MAEALDPTQVGADVRRWYEVNGRRLAFRRSAEPWGVMVSEVMLQQTQVSRVEVAWTRFMALFPTPAALAAATPADAIRAWAGLGYNRRALNLWRAATRIVEQHSGRVPQRLEDLLGLPGIGGYTARAISAISFGNPVAAVDTNVRRVVLRLHRLEGSPGVGQRQVQALADQLVDPVAPDLWTHAVMDIGATLCRPGQPRCHACPLARWCGTAATGASRATGATAIGATRSVRPVRFEQTSRWLRGRIVARLRDAPEGEWLTLDTPIGSHDRNAVAHAVAALAAEGILDVRDGPDARLAGGPGVGQPR